jgi:lipopolysaccharide transport system ATP-binding protein
MRMDDAAIVGQELGKRYKRGLNHGGGLRHSLDLFLRSPMSAFRREKEETFWALQDVSLEIPKGEVLGLVGRNGAGKTTLLKILSRITRPTLGWAEIHGRVGSLLEVGTGFHPELTGRENAFLSGAILGMGRREIERKFDEIVAFAELEKFIDTPVKHYSSGMYVRLAFAVAAHLEPEILLVDEVLAVGDINFQKKCLGKMGDVARVGRTVVLVSHQLNQIRRLCQRAIWIDGGRIRMDGATHRVLAAYESAMFNGDSSASPTADQQQSGRSAKGQFLRWQILGASNEGAHTLGTLGRVTISFTLKLSEHLKKGCHGIALYNHDRQLIFGHATDGLELSPGEHDLCHEFPMLPLRPGSYTWRVSMLEDHEKIDDMEFAPQMIVATDMVTHYRDEWTGILNVPTVLSISSRTGSSK